jgi:hypothetical protein
MFPALSKSTIAQPNQGTYSNKAGIAMFIVGLFLNESAHTSVRAVNEIDQILSHTMQTRW